MSDTQSWDMVDAMDAELAAIGAGVTVSALTGVARTEEVGDLLDKAQTAAHYRRELGTALDNMAETVARAKEQLGQAHAVLGPLVEVYVLNTTIDEAGRDLRRSVGRLIRAKDRWVAACAAEVGTQA